MTGEVPFLFEDTSMRPSQQPFWAESIWLSIRHSRLDDELVLQGPKGAPLRWWFTAPLDRSRTVGTDTGVGEPFLHRRTLCHRGASGRG